MCGRGTCVGGDGETATAADGTHPTGMHSCLAKTFHKHCIKVTKNWIGRVGEASLVPFRSATDSV